MAQPKKVSDQTGKAQLQKLLDQQKAELDALKRDRRVEEALERVRTRAMAMNNSEDLGEATSVLFHELKNLGLILRRSGIAIIHKADKQVEIRVNTDTDQKDRVLQTLGSVPVYVNELFKSYFKAWSRKQSSWQYTLKGEAVKQYYESINPYLSLPKQKSYNQQETYYGFFFPDGALNMVSEEPLSTWDKKILQRFSKVFGLTYRRYLDIKKAEAQAREAQIEAALEKVRSRTMAMQKSDELLKVAEFIFIEFQQVSKDPIDISIFQLDHANRTLNGWSAMPIEGNISVFSYTLPPTDHPLISTIFDQYLRQKKQDTYFLAGEEKISFDDIFFQAVPIPEMEEVLRSIESCYINLIYNSNGCLAAITSAPLSNDVFRLLHRFAKVVDLSYTRFLDLQKAEAQAREAQIETALEKLRSQMLAMQDSAELEKTCAVMYQQMHDLGIVPTGALVYIAIVDEKTESAIQWIVTDKTLMIPPGEGKAIGTPMNEHPRLIETYEGWKRRDPLLIRDLQGEQLLEFGEYLKSATPWNEDNFAEGQFPDRLVWSEATFSHGTLGMIYTDTLPKASLDILIRFSRVFDLVYQRFLDLQKAEAQAQEALIEAALERVRSRTMGMQQSDELSDVSTLLFKELNAFCASIQSSGLVLCDRDIPEHWMCAPDIKMLPPVHIPKDLDPVIGNLHKAWESGVELYSEIIEGALMQQHSAAIMNLPEVRAIYKKLPADAVLNIPQSQINYTANFKQGYLLIITQDPLNDPELLPRFSTVFEQTYTRFLDLQKAEKQARESEIEAALERVRAKAMSMQHSDDLAQSVATTLDELEKLELQIQRCGVGIFDRDRRTVQIWTTLNTEKEKQVIVIGEVSMMKHPLLRGSYEAWLNKQGYSYMLEGEDLRDYYTMLSEEGFALPADIIKKSLLIERQYYSYFTFHAGGLYVISEQKLSEDDGKIIQRFADVFHLAFTRYLDLQNAEARTREAVRQASLDRVRAEIASMRTADDLERITPLIWNELTTLDVPFIRCGVFIIEKELEKVSIYLSTPSGASLAAMQLKFNETPLVTAAIDHWEQQKVYTEEWDQEQFKSWTQSLIKKGLIQNPKKYQASEEPPEKLVLQLFPYTQGMLYVGSQDHLSKDQISLVQGLADAFAVAYARYEDFKQLEMAKKRIETTLDDLKSTQNQLIHAEKMASLGELTAGIAHEIQNPLNFVNNFSEVSADLIEELKAENSKLEPERDKELEKEILNDVISNLEKINHHGQRASSIVKGMLEHSRTGTKEKQLTDINQLADEYLRLAYHGLRAKDKTFNAEFATDLDEKLPKINVIGQDLGRVLLNLINNAFFAVWDKSKKHIEGYKPTVTVKTRKVNNHIEIRVKDNADGIPAHVIDKIFQPFFTTKPTGQGTGLGLSLSYDIITKGHNGSLEVDTTEGIGTEFIIQLDVS